MTCKKETECVHGIGCFIKDDWDVARCSAFKRKPQEQTNEKWFCELSIEEKAEFSMRVFKNCAWCLDGGSPNVCPFNDFLNCPAESKENMMKWLKEIHE